MQGSKLSEDVTVAGQVTGEDVRQVAREGFRSVLNLRAPEEEGVLSDEQEQSESAGLTYVNIPVRKQEINDAAATRILAAIDDLPKPALVHCGTGMRAGAMAFMHRATRQGLSAEEAMTRAHRLGFDCSSEPELKLFFEHYIDAHSKRGSL